MFQCYHLKGLQLQNTISGVSIAAQRKQIQPGTMRLRVRSLAAMSWGVGRRCGSDLALLWLWCRPADTAPIQLLAWKPSYAEGAALKRQKTKNKKKTNAEAAGGWWLLYWMAQIQIISSTAGHKYQIYDIYHWDRQIQVLWPSMQHRKILCVVLCVGFFNLNFNSRYKQKFLWNCI